MSDRQKTPTSFERRLLVWYKRFPSLEQVPTAVDRGILERVRTKFRIHLNVATMVASCFGFAYYSWAGKQAVKEGRGIHAVNKDWHKEIDASTDANTTQLPSIKKGI